MITFGEVIFIGIISKKNEKLIFPLASATATTTSIHSEKKIVFSVNHLHEELQSFGSKKIQKNHPTQTRRLKIRKKEITHGSTFEEDKC